MLLFRIYIKYLDIETSASYSWSGPWHFITVHLSSRSVKLIWKTCITPQGSRGVRISIWYMYVDFHDRLSRSLERNTILEHENVELSMYLGYVKTPLWAFKNYFEDGVGALLMIIKESNNYIQLKSIQFNHPFTI